VAASPEEDNPAHALIIMEGLGRNQLKRAAKELANACEWAITPS
jgi:hypothetical protein